ncbi:MAG: hypothetical protein GEU80_02650 [Dehalococcoidia bacterium]|nr:hypothetical protein [Dehalococcoidia bacterium]
MKVIGKDIGEKLDALYAELEKRVRIEGERGLRVESFEGGSFSNVSWDDDAVVISLHNGVPTHALPHVFGVALQHVRQRLDRYPAVRPAQQGNQPGAGLVRNALRELVMAPEADAQLERYELDEDWEVEQRHAGFKEMVRDAPEEWNRLRTPGHAFAALQYARFALQHPAELWESLREQMTERFPAAAESGEGVAQVVRTHGWKSPGGCLESLIAARDELDLRAVAVVEDRRSGKLL